MGALGDLIYGYRRVFFGGAELPQRGALEFAGAGVVSTDDVANARTLVTIAGAASGAALPAGCSALTAVQDVATAGLSSNLALAANAFITLLRFTDGVGPSLDGVVSAGGAFRIIVIRPSASSVQIVDYTTSASAGANQFETGVTLATTGAGGIWAYDPTSLRWINLGHQF